MSADHFIWISRWGDFQHYKPERDRGPAWIKDYTKQMLDDRYLELTDRQRALLRDLRDVFAMCSGRLPDDTRTIARHRHRHTRDADLKALSDAGFIEVVSRETLERSLEQLYSPPRARVEGEEDKEPPTPTDVGDQTSRSRKTKIEERLPFEAVQPSKQLQRAEAFTRNAGHQYEPLGFEEELARFSLPPGEHEQIKSLYATLRTNGAEPDELPWEGEEPPIVT